MMKLEDSRRVVLRHLLNSFCEFLPILGFYNKVLKVFNGSRSLINSRKALCFGFIALFLSLSLKDTNQTIDRYW